MVRAPWAVVIWTRTKAWRCGVGALTPSYQCLDCLDCSEISACLFARFGERQSPRLVSDYFFERKG
eukprot:scaffold9184_cov66-Phaeocystis_antarctica.AAC.3